MFHVQGGPKVLTPTFGLIATSLKVVVNLIFYAKHYNHQPFEDFTKIKQKWVHFLFIFVHFRLFLGTSGQVTALILITLCLASQILATLKKWAL